MFLVIFFNRRRYEFCLGVYHSVWEGVKSKEESTVCGWISSRGDGQLYYGYRFTIMGQVNSKER